MQIISENCNGVKLIKINGSMTVENIYSLKDTIEFIEKAKPCNVVIDLGNVNSIDSSGIGSIAFIAKRCRSSQGGDLKIASLTEYVNEVFKIVGFDKIFEIFLTADEAVKSFE